MTDVELLSAMSQGNREAFGAFYDCHAGLAHRVIQRIVGEAHAAEDVLQDVFLQVWSRAAQFDAGRGSPAAWVVLLARSRALDHTRRRKRTPPPQPVAEPTGGDASEAPQQREMAAAANRALHSLPIEQKRAIQLAFFDGMSHSEIADQLEVPLGTVKTRIRSGMTRLRDALTAGAA